MTAYFQRSHSSGTSFAWTAIGAFFVAGALGGGLPDEAAAQTSDQTADRLSPTADLLHKPSSISPKSGPPGTEVRVRGAHLPAITPVNVAFGGTRSGFEGLSFILTTTEGEVEDRVRIPEWAERDRVHRFIIFDAYFDPISMTEIFHVTDEDGKLFREARVLSRESGCVHVQGRDEDEYYLVGGTDAIEETLSYDGWITFEGRPIESTQCSTETPHVEVVSAQRLR